jgi:hypothetical protein
MRKFTGYLAGLLLLQYQVIALAAPEVLTDGMGFRADFADYRTDGGGNLHLVWHDKDVEMGAIMYMMFNSAGDILIDRTQVNEIGTGNNNTRPAIEVDATGMLFVVWEDMTAQEVRFMRLDPALRDNDPATQDPIKDLTIGINGEVIISAASGDNATHPRIRIDASGDLHVVWESTNGGTVQYVKISDAGGVAPVIGMPVPLGNATIGNSLPDIDIDTNGHAHIVFSNTAAVDEVYYAMIDGATGAVLIDATPLSDDGDGLLAGSATVNVDLFDNTLYIVFKQVTDIIAGTEEIFLARLNPSPGNQPAVVKLFEKQITNGEGQLQWHVTSRITSDKRIHATYIDFNEGACSDPYTITDAHITFAGTVLLREVLTTTGSATSCFPQARSAPGRNRIVWTDNDTAMGTEIFASKISRADAGSSGFSCSLGNPHAAAWRAGELWLLLGLLSLLAVRRFRRSR